MAEGFDKAQATQNLKQLLNMGESKPEDNLRPQGKGEGKKKKKAKKLKDLNSSDGSDGNQSYRGPSESGLAQNTNSNGNALLMPAMTPPVSRAETGEAKDLSQKGVNSKTSLPNVKKKEKIYRRRDQKVDNLNDNTAPSPTLSQKKQNTTAKTTTTTAQDGSNVIKETVGRKMSADTNQKKTDDVITIAKRTGDLGNGNGKGEPFRGGGGGPSNSKRDAELRDRREGKQENKGGRRDGTNGSQSEISRGAKSNNVNNNKPKPRPGKLGEENLSPEFMQLLESNKMHLLKKKNLRFPKAKYFCRLCDYHIDCVEDCEKHMKDNRHCRRKEISDVDAILRSMPEPTERQLAALTEAVDKVYEEHGIDEWEQKQRADIVSRLETILKEKIPDVVMFMYGSSLTGFGLKSADINVDLTSAEKNRKLTHLLREVYLNLKDRTDTGFSNVRSDFSAKIPGLLMADDVTGFTVSVTIHCYSAHCSSELLAIYSDFDVRVRKLAVAFRFWANVCGLDRQCDGFIPPHALNLMVIYFLQVMTPQVVPIIQPPKVTGEDVGDFRKDAPAFEKMRAKAINANMTSKNKMSVGQLWLKLLRFYSLEFDTPNVVVSIRSAEPLSRGSKPWNSKKLAVEDPYMQKKNITRMVNNSRIYEYWQNSIRKAFHYFGLPRNAEGKSYISMEMLKEALDLQQDSNTYTLMDKKTSGDKTETKNDSNSQKVTDQATKETGKENEKKKSVGDVNSDGDGNNDDDDDICLLIAPNPLLAKAFVSTSLDSKDSQKGKGKLKSSFSSESGEGGRSLSQSCEEDEKTSDSETSKNQERLPENNGGSRLKAAHECSSTSSSEERRDSNNDISSLSHAVEQLTLSSGALPESEATDSNSILSRSRTESSVITDTSIVAGSASVLSPAIPNIDQASLSLSDISCHVQDSQVKTDSSCISEKNDSSAQTKDEDIIDSSEKLNDAITSFPDQSGVSSVSTSVDSKTETVSVTKDADSKPAQGEQAMDTQKISSDGQVSGSGVGTKDTATSSSPKGVFSGVMQKDCVYEFLKDYLTDGKGPTLVCTYCEKEGHLKNACPEDELPEVLPLPTLTPFHLKVLSETLEKVPDDVGLSEDSLADRRMFLSCLQEFIRMQFNDAQLSLFGSSCNGFGFDKSDIDICLTFSRRKMNDKIWVIDILARRLKQNADLFNVQAIPTAKVPIVKFTVKKTDLEGDISLYNTLAQHNTRLLYSYSQIDPRVRILGYAIKTFAKVCDIGDASRGSLSSYGYILMMLYYLQQVKPPVIPVLQELYEGKEKPQLIIESCDAWFMEDLSKLDKLWAEKGKNTMSVAELWLGFLRFYVEEFNYKEYVVSIRQKELLTRFEKLWNGECIAIEDPFDVSHNLGSGLMRKMNNFIFKTFINGRMLYGSPIDDNMEMFTSYKAPSDYFFDTDLLSENRPPNVRGCRRCGKIGHLVRHCPVAKREKDEEQRKSQQPQQQQQQQQQQLKKPVQPQQQQRQPPQQQSLPEHHKPSPSPNQQQRPESHQKQQRQPHTQHQQTPQPPLPSPRQQQQRQPSQQQMQQQKQMIQRFNEMRERDRRERDHGQNGPAGNINRNSSAPAGPAMPYNFETGPPLSQTYPSILTQIPPHLLMASAQTNLSHFMHHPSLQAVTPTQLRSPHHSQVYHNTSLQQQFHPHQQQHHQPRHLHHQQQHQPPQQQARRPLVGNGPGQPPMQSYPPPLMSSTPRPSSGFSIPPPHADNYYYYAPPPYAMAGMPPPGNNSQRNPHGQTGGGQSVQGGGGGHPNNQTMSVAVQNLFASARGQVLDAGANQPYRPK